MTYVLERTDQGGGYVTRPGHARSYSKRLQDAQGYRTREQAEESACENERAVSVDFILMGEGE